MNPTNPNPQPGQSPAIEQKFSAIVAEMNRLREVRKVKAEAFSDRLGMKRTSIYDLLAGRFIRKDGKRNFSDVVINKVYNELVARQQPVAIGSYRFLSQVAESAQAQGLMVCVSGQAGAGKSTALKHVTDSRENVHYVLCDHFDSPEDFIERIHNSFGLTLPDTDRKSRGRRRRKLMIEAVADYVARSEAKPLLILDDIHHLSLAAYQDLKVLFDHTEGALGMLLVGTPLLEQKLKKLAGYDIDWNPRYAPRAIMPEFVRRFKGNFYQVPAIQPEDLEAIARHYGIADKEAVRIARHFARLPHLELGMFADKLEKAVFISQAQGSEANLELLTRL